MFMQNRVRSDVMYNYNNNNKYSFEQQLTGFTGRTQDQLDKKKQVLYHVGTIFLYVISVKVIPC